MKESLPDISIIIVSYNKPHFLRKCLDSLYHFHSNINLEIIVIDNNSSEENVELIKNNFPQVYLIENKENVGFAKANNLGVKYAKGNILAFVNSDVEFISNIFDVILKYAEYKKFGAIGIQLLNADGSLQKSYYKFPSLLQRIFVLTKLNKILKPESLWLRLYTKNSKESPLLGVQSIRGAFMVISKRQFDRIGGFDENYFLYHEELDLCFQLHQAGLPVLFDPNLFVIHYGENKELPENTFVFYQRNRSLLYFYHKNFKKHNSIILVIINVLFLSAKMLLSISRSSHYFQSYVRVLKMNLFFLKNSVIFGKSWDIPNSINEYYRK